MITHRMFTLTGNPLAGSWRVYLWLGSISLMLSALILLFSRVLIIVFSALFLLGALYLFRAAFRSWRAERYGGYAQPAMRQKSDVIEIIQG